MTDSGLPNRKNGSLYSRIEQRFLQQLPPWLTPLRFRILLGYCIVILLGIYGWDQITSAWRYFVTLMAPVAALFGALLALKLSVVLMSVVTLMSALLKIFFGFLMMVLKPGILKAIFVPQLLTLLGWFHRKSARLQSYVRRIYDRCKSVTERIGAWWNRQNSIDKILLSGFLIPLLVILLIVFILKRAITMFAVKKATEQVVQKTTKFIIKNFHRIPLIGPLPALIANKTRTFTKRDDRDDVVEDLKSLGRELYVPDEQLNGQ